jgi:tRNA(Ile)-lysidine synthase
MSTQNPVTSNSAIEKKILRIVDQTLRAHSMIQNGDSVLMGVSGGPDSVALFHILRALGPRYGLRLAIAHLNHCLRANESDRDQAFVTALAKQFDVPIYVEKQDVHRFQKNHHLSVEEAGRQVRYRFYHRTAARYQYDKIALGHHADDNAELVLMSMLRGSGPLGLAGMPAVRPDNILRPLINLRRSAILEYLATCNLDYVMDSSNRDLRFLRNQIRNRLIPELQAEYNPKCVDSLNRLAAILSAEEEWLEDTIQPIFNKALVFEKPDRLGLGLAPLKQLPIAAQRRLIRKALFKVKGNLRRIAFSHIEAILGLIQQGPLDGMLDLPDGMCVWRDRGMLLISKAQPKSPGPADQRSTSAGPDYIYQLPMAGEILIKEAGLQIRFSDVSIKDISDWRQPDQQVAFLDRDKLSFPLVIRNFRPGDRFSPLGICGHQKLKKFFIDHKISRSERMKCPIVLSRDKIIWVAGHRLDNAVKIDSQTRRVLKAELLLA